MRPFIKIDTQLSLHLARPELAPAIFDAVNTHRDYLRQWLPWVDPTTSMEDTTRFLKESMEHNSKGTQLITFLMVGQELAGSLSVVQFNKDCKKCEIGYWLREDIQGNGFMTKACAALIDYLFKTKDLNRIEIFTAKDNAKSQAISRRLGFVHEGTLRQGLFMYGTFHDLEMFSMLRQEWQGFINGASSHWE
ncbi:MAG: GNAT family N-acetyltransferase [Saprospiraceae bacterium]